MSTPRRILVINGHPDSSDQRFCAALAAAYEKGAAGGGHETRRIDIGRLDFPLIRSRPEFETDEPPAAIAAAQADIAWSQHLVLIHPLWLGAAPALTKGFFEQAFRYGFAMAKPGSGLPARLLTGRSARIVVTMGMPGPAYSVLFGAFGVRAMERGILRLAGFGPIRHDFFGMVEGDPAVRHRRLEQMAAAGARGE